MTPTSRPGTWQGSDPTVIDMHKKRASYLDEVLDTPSLCIEWVSVLPKEKMQFNFNSPTGGSFIKWTKLEESQEMMNGNFQLICF